MALVGGANLSGPEDDGNEQLHADVIKGTASLLISIGTRGRYTWLACVEGFFTLFYCTSRIIKFHQSYLDIIFWYSFLQLFTQ